MLSRCAFAIAFVAVVSAAQAATVIPPAGLNPGDQFRLIFITSDTVTGFDPTIEFYDNHVAGLAAGAGLLTYGSQSITWLALACAAGLEASARLINTSVPLYTLGGELISDSTIDIWGPSPVLFHTVDVDENGNAASGLVWSGSDGHGDSSPCTQLGSNCGPGTTSAYGDSTLTDFQWLTAGFMDQSNTAHLYGLSNVLTVEAVATPEPSTLLLLTGGLGSVLARFRRRK